MRSPIALPLVALVFACGGREVPVPGPIDGGPRPDAGHAGSYVIDATDIDALNDCYSPERLYGGGLEDPPNCATECVPPVPRGFNRYPCGPICTPSSNECHNTDWTVILRDEDHAGACE